MVLFDLQRVTIFVSYVLATCSCYVLNFCLNQLRISATLFLRIWSPASISKLSGRLDRKNCNSNAGIFQNRPWQRGLVP